MEKASMRIDIKGSGFPITSALMEHTERRLRFALTRSSDRIVRVVVLLGDINGPRGGEDKFCRIQILMKGTPQVLIEDIGAELYAVIDRAAERAGRNVAKQVERLNDNAREEGRSKRRASSGEVPDGTDVPIE